MSKSASVTETARKQKQTSPWIPVSMLVITTAALALPLALLRRQRGTVSSLRRTSPSPLRSPPPVRQAPPSASHHPPPRIAPAQTTPPTPTPLRTPSESSSLHASREDSFNDVLYSLKAFSIATALVVAGGVTSVWGVKAYLGIKDTREFASAMRLTVLDTWPLLTSRIHSASGASSSSSLTTSESKPESPNVDVDVEEWSWQAAESRLKVAYERGGVAQLAQAVAGELEAELELERRRRRGLGLGDSSEGRRR